MPNRFDLSGSGSARVARSVLLLAALLAAGPALAQPVNDVCSGALVIPSNATFPYSAPVTDIATATTTGDPLFTCGTAGRPVWYQFTPTETALYRVGTCGLNADNSARAIGSITDTLISIHTGSCGSTVEVANACSDDVGGACSARSSVQALLTAGTTYYFMTAPFSVITGTIGVTVDKLPSLPPANDNCSGAVALAEPTLSSPTTAGPTSLEFATQINEPLLSCDSSNLSGGSQRGLWYAFTPTTSGRYSADTCATANVPAAVTDTSVVVYTSSGGATCGTMTEVTGTCNDSACGAHGQSSFNAVAGTTYFINVMQGNRNIPIPGAQSFMLRLSVTNETCSTAAPLALSTPVVGVMTTAVVNDTTVDGGAGPYTGIGHTTTVSGSGRDLVYQFVVPSTGAYSFRMVSSSTTPNHLLYIGDTCQVGNTLPPILAAANRSTSFGEELFCVPLTLGQNIYAFVDEATLSTTAHTFDIEVTPCQLETEPNDTPPDAGTPTCGIEGSITTANEVDFFSLGSPVANSRVFAMVDGVAANPSNLTSFDLRVTTATDTLEFDNADNDSRYNTQAPNIAGTTLSGAASFLRVNYPSATVASEPYRLYTVIQPPGTSIAEVEPNDTAPSASGGASNYFSGALSTATDVDFYGFLARPGDLIMVNLDADPTRDNTPFNATISLQDDNGVAVTTGVGADVNATSSIVASPATLVGLTPNSPAEVIVFRVRRAGTYYVRVSGSAAGDYLLSISNGCVIGGGFTAPGTVTGITPAVGSTLGGTQVTVTGTGFERGARVRIGGTFSPNTQFTNATTLTAVTPPGVAGNQLVEVVHPGNLAAGLPNGFQYIPPPTFTSISPVSGTTLGGTAFTITGTDFVGTPSSVLIGGAPPATVSFLSSAQITGTTAANAPGAVDITIATPFGSTTAVGAYSYIAPIPPPVATSMTPNSGTTLGGTTVVIAGTGFRAGVTVRFGTVSSTNVTLDSATQLTVVTPPAAAGLVTVAVTNTDAQSSSVPNGFTYFAPPAGTGISPNQGYAVGGTNVTITGTGFRAGATVQFIVGGVAQPATNVVVTSTTITARAPAHTPGLSDVVITNVDSQTTTLPNAFRFVPAPTLASITPSNGAATGGTAITLTGTAFQPGAAVSLGGSPAFAVNVASNGTSLTAVTNARPAGTVDVVVTNPDGQTVTLANGYTFNQAPVLSSLTPDTGPIAGGQVVTLSGNGFQQGATVVFGTTSGTVTNVTATRITVTSPARPAGVVSVRVTNTDGQSSVLTNAYRYIAPPALASLTPATGPSTGGTLITLTGTFFTADAQVTFGGTPATQVTVMSATTIQAVTPAHAAGAVDVVVSSASGTSTLAAAFTYQAAAPTIAGVAPTSGSTEGGTTVTVTGTGFLPGATVKIGGVDASAVVVSSTLIRAVTAAHVAGIVSVTVTNPGGLSADLPASFTYVAPSSPTEGRVTDGGTGGVTDTTGGNTDVIRPAGACGCNAGGFPALALLSFAALALFRRRRT